MKDSLQSFALVGPVQLIGPSLTTAKTVSCLLGRECSHTHKVIHPGAMH